MSKHREPERGRNPLHGTNTLIVNIPEGLTLGNRYHGRVCRDCRKWERCRPIKGDAQGSLDYCATGWGYEEGRYAVQG